MTLYLVVRFLTFYLMVDSSSQLKLSIFFEKVFIFIRIFGGWFLHYLLAQLVFAHVSRFIFPYLYFCNQGNLIFNDLKFFGKIAGFELEIKLRAVLIYFRKSQWKTTYLFYSGGVLNAARDLDGALWALSPKLVQSRVQVGLGSEVPENVNISVFDIVWNFDIVDWVGVAYIIMVLATRMRDVIFAVHFAFDYFNPK